MKKIIVILIFIITSLIISEVPAQVTQEWVATYGGVGTGYNTPRKSSVDKFGNYIVAGSSENSVDYDYIVLKYNTSGNLLWSRRYNSPVNRKDYLTDMVLDDSGNVYVTGESYVETTGGDLDWITIKYKPNGDTAWIRSFEWTGEGPDEPFGMALDNMNNIYITGFCLAAPPNGMDMVTAKYNSAGVLQWARSYSSTQNAPDWGYAICTDDSNNVYSSGYGYAGGNNEIVTIKYNSNGDQLWIRKFPTLGGDYLRPVKSIMDKYNNIIVNGLYYLGEQYAFNTIKYNSNGDLLWNRYYKGAGNLNFCFALCTDSSANVYVAGRNTSTGTGNDFLTIKYNHFGDTSWIRIYDGGFEQGDEVRAMVVDNLENVYVTGGTDSLDGSANYLTMKYDSLGNIKWVRKFNGVGVNNRSDISYTISIDNNGSVILSGNSGLSNNHSGIVTVKYSVITNFFNNNFNKENLKFILFQNYPNPFNPTTTISFSIKDRGNVKLDIFNLEGKKVKNIIYKKFESGDYNIKFDGSDLATGIYFYSLLINNIVIDTKKMILLK